MAASLPQEARAAYKRLDRRLDRSYDKIFAGNNLPAMRKPNLRRRYRPQWSRGEVEDLVELFSCGLRMLRRAAGPATN